MAKYNATCKECKQEEQVVLFGPYKSRERILDNYTCSLCQAKAMQAAHKAKNEAAAKANQEEGLPPLVGTAKQVAWAESIRREQLDKLMRRVTEIKSSCVPVTERQFFVHRRFDEMVLEYKAQTAARVWIDGRYNILGDVITKAVIKEANDLGL